MSRRDHMQTTFKKHEKIPSNKKFGLSFSAIFLFLGCYFVSEQAYKYAYLVGSLSALFLVVAILAPSIFYPLNKSWYNLGVFLGRVVSPLILASIFFFLIVPVALVTRSLGRDVLSLRKKRVSTYWVERKEHGNYGSFTDQF